MSKGALLYIQELRTQFHTHEGLVTAVDGVSLKIGHGEILGLVGESGCGKTVTALSLLRLLRCPPAELHGSILLNGKDLLSLSPNEMRRVRGKAISMIFQEPMTSLNPLLTIGEQIMEGLMLHERLKRKEAKERAVEMLKKVQIPSAEHRINEYPHRLSGGMRQRVMIAMALSCNPQVLIADEPTTALDVTIQAQIVDLIMKIREEMGTSIILITHNLGLIVEMARRVAVMYTGKIVEEAHVEDLFKHPLHPYTKGLLKSIPWIGKKVQGGKRRLQEIPGVVPGLLELPSGCSFHPRCPEKDHSCLTQAPPILEIHNGHRVRCWRHIR